MMPLNTAERKSAFFLFLLFFIISLVIVVATVFFGVQVPLKQNEVLKSKIADFQNDREFLQKFSGKVSETWSMLDKIDKQGIEQPELIDSKIGANLDTLGQWIGNDTTAQKKIFVNIILSLNSLKLAKDGLRNRGTSDHDKADLEQKLRDANQALFNCQTSLNIALSKK